ncbi:MAG: riboflavin kinase [Gammaproteobacteria bacterium]|nr:riboflavin kinase [Gammaproteobacteria bacterium]
MEYIDRVRMEQPFDSAEALVKQMQTDMQQARRILGVS